MLTSDIFKIHKYINQYTNKKEDYEKYCSLKFNDNYLSIIFCNKYFLIKYEYITDLNNIPNDYNNVYVLIKEDDVNKICNKKGCNVSFEFNSGIKVFCNGIRINCIVNNNIVMPYNNNYYENIFEQDSNISVSDITFDYKYFTIINKIINLLKFDVVNVKFNYLKEFEKKYIIYTMNNNNFKLSILHCCDKLKFNI